MDTQGPPREQTGGSPFAEKRIGLFYLLGALLLTIGVRLYLFMHYYTINNDGVLYIEAARYFWEGRWLEGLASFYPPVFPFMIALIYPLVGDWELAGQFWPFVLGVLLAFPLFGLLRRIYGTQVANVAIFFYAASPYLARLSLHVRSEIPYIFFLILALYFFQIAICRGGGLPLFLMGVSAALAYLTRPEAMGLVILGVLFLVYRGWLRKEMKKAWLNLATLSLGFMILAAPYIFYLKWDTGKWVVSRKLAGILSQGLLEYDPDLEHITQQESVRGSALQLIASRPLIYVKKVSIDFFRSVGAYLEAVHYSYLPFLFLGWFLFFRKRSWQGEEFFLFLVVVWYLLTFSLLYVTRRYTVPLVPFSLGWVKLGFLTVQEYFHHRWKQTGYLLAGLVIVLFLVGTLPKTFQPIGREKLYLREAGAYLKGKPGNVTILTTNGRVAFYAEGQNRVLLKGMRDFPAVLAMKGADYLALDQEVFQQAAGTTYERHGWHLEREFSDGRRERLLVLRRIQSP